MNPKKPALTLQKSNRLLADSLLAIAIIASPIIFYSYECFPDIKVWRTFLFTYTSHYYESVSTFVWVFLQKFIFLYLLIIWFFTSNNWFNKSILAPIGMLIYQIIGLINEEIQFIETVKIDKFVILPIVIGILVFLLQLRNKLSFYANALDLKEQIETEIYKIETDCND